MRRILLGMILCCAALPALTAEEDIVLRVVLTQMADAARTA